ncbi:hypothetical protein BX616_003715 [Lobosporangium transversale]|uniref:Uncharacterized protein n=1 Tax=Lobosporangium transversale TaxID=64571 RepID=A0A1Y2GFC0_9FUNG|nr:hypothetical protein BCR41DRAFT_358555 [Lobosporangium transversale]KAF9898688.1 hypothetical protein BX616_003715 [Lobosporangium transversale]ORZ09339.1 hypothetical protein BCR41DRAFT_358555 [Lobosporangium transversale]|eukprot:XP_021878792.1 hypothetical protein BCR41DRAFT_358555 [Lobosporangium transversale]
MDLNWCPVCEQHIPLAWESSLYCSERCKNADALASSSIGGYPTEMPSFSRGSQKKSMTSSTSPSYSPLSSPSLIGINSTPATTASNNMYPSPPTSPMGNYIYNKTSGHGRISPPLFTLDQPAVTPAYDLQLRRKSTTTVVAPQYAVPSKKGFFL